MLYADLGVAGVLFTFADHEAAMYGTVLYAVIGSYASYFVTARAVAAHVCFAIVVVGVLGVLTYREGVYGVAAVLARGLTSAIAVSAAVILAFIFNAGQKHVLTSQLVEAARDPLTGLWNRRGFAALVMDLLIAERTIAFIVLDVDGFKRVNDQYGHTAGDEVLQLLAERLRRLGGLRCTYGGRGVRVGPTAGIRPFIRHGGTSARCYTRRFGRHPGHGEYRNLLCRLGQQRSSVD